jgi:putative spermidine/putrescine transport system permease protein
MITRRGQWVAAALSRLLAWSLLGFLFLPLLVVIPVSLTDHDYLSLPENGISWQHFTALFDWDTGWLPSILTSAGVGIACSAVATTLGVAFAVGAWAVGGGWPSVMRIVLLSPLIVPPIIYGVGMVKLWGRLSLLDTYTGVVIVHVMLALPLVVLAVSASLSNLDPRMVYAARSLGARPMRVMATIVLPNILPAIATGAAFAFVVSWDEITVTLLITGRAVVTLPRRMWTSIADAVDPSLAAVATLLLVLTVVAIIIFPPTSKENTKP